MAFVSEILIAGIFATISMTCFSYAMSFILSSNFKEPQILNFLIYKDSSNQSFVKRHHIYGWLIHFFVGIMFVVLFKIIQISFNLELSYLNGLIYGFLGGLLAILVYTLAFAIFSKPPITNRSLFFGQLVIAHIIFGFVMLFFLRHL